MENNKQLRKYYASYNVKEKTYTIPIMRFECPMPVLFHIFSAFTANVTERFFIDETAER